MSTFTAIKKRLGGRDDEAIERELAEQRAKLRALEVAKAREDVTEAVDRWLATARGTASRRAVPALSSGSLGFSSEAVFDIVASVVLHDPQTRSRLYELTDSVAKHLPTRKARDEQTEAARTAVADLEAELARRAIERERAEVAKRQRELEARLNASRSRGDKAA